MDTDLCTLYLYWVDLVQMSVGEKRADNSVLQCLLLCSCCIHELPLSLDDWLNASFDFDSS